MSKPTNAKVEYGFWPTMLGFFTGKWCTAQVPVVPDEEIAFPTDAEVVDCEKSPGNSNGLDDNNKELGPPESTPALVYSEECAQELCPPESTAGMVCNEERDQASPPTSHFQRAMGDEFYEVDDASRGPLDHLLIAIGDGTVEEVLTYLNNETVNAKHAVLGIAPLHAAILWASAAIVETVVAAGADLNARDDAGRTPLVLAAETSDRDSVLLLIEKGAELSSLAEVLQRMQARPPPEVLTEVYLYKYNCTAYWHYAVSFDDVTVDYGRSRRQGVAIPGCGLEICCNEDWEDPDVQTYLGSVPFRPGELLALAICKGLGQWTRERYFLGWHNCQDFCCAFTSAIGLAIQGDAYLTTKRTVQGWFGRFSEAKALQVCVTAPKLQHSSLELSLPEEPSPEAPSPAELELTKDPVHYEHESFFPDPRPTKESPQYNLEAAESTAKTEEADSDEKDDRLEPSKSEAQQENEKKHKVCLTTPQEYKCQTPQEKEQEEECSTSLQDDVTTNPDQEDGSEDIYV